MGYYVRKANNDDLPRIEEIYAYARSFMAKTGNPNQWGTNHPPAEQLRRDIVDGTLRVITDEKEIHGVFFCSAEDDPTYAEIHDGAWRSDRPYAVIHRIAGDGSGGILKTAVSYVEGICRHIRIDTHADNRVMQSALGKLGFQRCGIIYLANGEPRIAYDRIGDDAI